MACRQGVCAAPCSPPASWRHVTGAGRSPPTHVEPMTPLETDQKMIVALLAVVLALFLWRRWRHDVIALGALVGGVLLGLVPGEDAFAGFGHPAVITVACVLVLSRGLQNSGAVDLIARAVIPQRSGRFLSMGLLLALGAALSAFMNNVGAMALLMPVAVQLSGRLGLAPGQVLMPLAFGTILGGMTTLVGTPPNLIVSGARNDAGLGHFAMFDFSPVGVAVAAAGVVLIVLVGWRLVPARRAGEAEGFDTAAYFTEVRVPDGAKIVDRTLRQVEDALGDTEAQVVGLVRGEVRLHAPHGGRQLRAGDILVVEADVEGLAEALARLGLKLEEEKGSGDKDREDGEGDGDGAADRRPSAVALASDEPGLIARTARKVTLRRKDAEAARDTDGSEAGEKEKDGADSPGDDEIVLREMVVLPGSTLAGRTATDLQLRTRRGINMLAVSREGKRPRARLRSLRLRVGDVLLLQGPPEALAAFASDFGCVPLAERSLRIPDRRMAALSVLVLGAAVAIASLGLLPTAVAFALGVVVSMVLRTVPPRAVYGAIDWPVIVLLGALIPIAQAMETTGTAALIAEGLVGTLAQGQAVVALVLLMVVTMFLSDLMNNAATAAVMAPIALGIAAALGVNPDSFLMAVAIGASCAFLTPIGHQNNTLILGPGGFGFGDYWRLGLPLEALVVAVSVPLLLLVWPL
ncbi:MAG: SLC13 family permease [Alkalilacustris sp.]